ncbi:MAG: inositol monophosphatase, partial [Proteobacteria bacterium]|nr:inositol monophosphatase [Pseudomonadota bacterium]
MSVALPDAARVATIIREVAAAEILPRYQALRASDIREKAPGDFVTAADLASEAALTRRLTELVPGSVVLGEEAAAADPSVFDRLDGDAPVWVIDPVDGTINFAKGRPGFVVIVAWIHRGRTLAGWIHDPLASVMVTAERGGGTLGDGGRLHVAADTPLDAMVGAAYGRVDPTTRTADRLAGSGRIGGVVNGMSSGIDYLALVHRRA